MKVIVSFSGGKDSLASLLWVRNNLTKDFITVFCDTGWEHPLTYKYIEEVQEQLGLNLITVKSKKFNGMVDLTKKKSRWPSSQRRFCTSELKTIPMIDYILDEVNDDVLIIQGIRAAESAKRAEMSKQCTYFKYFVDRFIEHTKAAEWGANWRINSVWHDAKECPERKRNYLAQCKNGRFNVIPDSMNWDNFYKKAEIIRWAYIEDLLPNMED